MNEEQKKKFKRIVENGRIRVDAMDALLILISDIENEALERSNAKLAALNLCEPGFLDRVIRERDEFARRLKAVQGLCAEAESAVSNG